jgi:hypothetical protein
MPRRNIRSRIVERGPNRAQIPLRLSREAAMGDVSKGLEAGFLATVLISILMFAQTSLGYVPQFNMISMLMSAAGTPDAPLLAWGFHFFIGTVLWGAGFAVFSPHLPGPHWFRGAIFGTLTWLAMMIVFLPSAGMHMFAAGADGREMILGVTLGLNLVYGVAVGEIYHLLLHYMASEVDENA